MCSVGDVFLLLKHMYRYGPGTYVGLLPISILVLFFGGCMTCVSCDMHMNHVWFALLFPWGVISLQSDWSLSCDHELDYSSDETTTTCSGDTRVLEYTSQDCLNYTMLNKLHSAGL